MNIQVFLFLVFLNAGCTTSKEVIHPVSQSSIGEATMLEDRTIVLHLRAETGGTIGDSVVKYAPGDRHYEAVLKHLAPIEPGQIKPVPPFPSDTP